MYLFHLNNFYKEFNQLNSMNDLDFMIEAYRYAMENATDPWTQNGAVIVKDGNIIAYGANHFPRGVQESDERWKRPLKYSFVEHAERNAIFDATRKGVSTKGTVMYVPWFACADCGRAIIQAGISEVVGHIGPEKWYLEDNREDWGDSIKHSLEMLDEAGVKYRWINDKIGNGIKIRFGGKIRTP